MPPTDSAPGGHAPAAGAPTVPPPNTGGGQGGEVPRAVIVDREHLAPGDEFTFDRIHPDAPPQPGRAVIEQIGDTQPFRRSGLRSRPAVCRDMATGATFERQFVARQLITGGPKLAAAAANPALVRHQVNGNALWIGEAANG